MEEKDHLALYQEIKSKFSAREGGITLISITSRNTAELTPLFFSDAHFAEYFAELTSLEDHEKPYAILSFVANEPRFFYCCAAFAQDECIRTGEVMEYIKNPFEKKIFDQSGLKIEYAC